MWSRTPDQRKALALVCIYGSICLLKIEVHFNWIAELHRALLLLFPSMSSSKAATDLQSVYLLVHCRAALHRSDHAHLCHDSYLYHNPRCPLFWIQITLIPRLNYRRLAVERRVEVVELRFLLGPRERRHKMLHNLLHDVVGCLLRSRYPLVNLHSDWSCSCHWCSRCYMTYSVKIRSMSAHCRNPFS